MTITTACFEAFLKCPTKCWLLSTNELHSGNPYANWVAAQSESFLIAQTERLLAETVPGEVVRLPTPREMKTSRYKLALGIAAQVSAQTTSGLPCPVESDLHALERVPAEGRGKAAHFIPIRHVFRNKPTKEDKLLVAFDAFVLGTALGRGRIGVGKIIHGDDHAALKVKRPSAPAGGVRKSLGKMAMPLLSNSGPPDLVLNRHCGECEDPRPVPAEGHREGRSQPPGRHEQRRSAKNLPQQRHLHSHAALLHVSPAPPAQTPPRKLE